LSPQDDFRARATAGESPRLERIKIVITNVPRMLREIIAGTLSTQSDMALVGEVSDPEALADAVTRTGADVVIWGAEGCDPAAVRWLLETRPTLKVLGVEDDGRRMLLHELQPHTSPLGELSAEALLTSIRAAYLSRN
jgi:DNA-binding NarL/FixJ family response regulator